MPNWTGGTVWCNDAWTTPKPLDLKDQISTNHIHHTPIGNVGSSPRMGKIHHDHGEVYEIVISLVVDSSSYIEVRILHYIANSEAIGTDEIAQGRWDSLGHAQGKMFESWNPWKQQMCLFLVMRCFFFQASARQKKTKPKNCRTIIKSIMFFTTHFWRCQDRQADHDRSWQVFTNLIMCFIALNAATLNAQWVGLQLGICARGRWYAWYDAICTKVVSREPHSKFAKNQEEWLYKAETDRNFSFLSLSASPVRFWTIPQGNFMRFWPTKNRPSSKQHLFTKCLSVLNVSEIGKNILNISKSSCKSPHCLSWIAVVGS